MINWFKNKGKYWYDSQYRDVLKVITKYRSELNKIAQEDA